MSSAAGTRRGSPRIRVMPAACMATSVPPPMAMPTSAAASAGASLMPSPTIATTRPRPFSSATVAALSAGSTSACTSSMPRALATTAALPRLSPVIRWLWISRPRRASTASAAPSLRLSPKANRPSTRFSGASSSSQDRVRPSASQSAAALASAPGLSSCSSSRRRLPRASRRPSTSPWMPRPLRAWLAFTGGTSRSRSAQRSSTALASGCSLPRCRAPASLSSCSGSSPPRWMICGRPEVRVPVLSKATLVTAWATSRDSASLIRMPWRAATPVPAMIAVGVARPRAQGQAITSTATALTRACSRPTPATSQAPRVTSAMRITTGTKTWLTLSTSFWIGALAAWASSTRRMIFASTVSPPSAVVRKSRRPSPLIAPPVTLSPGALGTGRLSPVISASSAWLLPSSTSPSTGKRSPGRTTTSSPRRNSAIATSSSRPSRRRTARSGRNASRARMALAVWRLARLSRYLPRRIRAITTVDASK